MYRGRYRALDSAAVPKACAALVAPGFFEPLFSQLLRSAETELCCGSVSGSKLRTVSRDYDYASISTVPLVLIEKVLGASVLEVVDSAPKISSMDTAQ